MQALLNIIATIVVTVLFVLVLALPVMIFVVGMATVIEGEWVRHREKKENR
jgi:hypothetical protein